MIPNIRPPPRKTLFPIHDDKRSRVMVVRPHHKFCFYQRIIKSFFMKEDNNKKIINYVKAIGITASACGVLAKAFLEWKKYIDQPKRAAAAKKVKLESLKAEEKIKTEAAIERQRKLHEQRVAFKIAESQSTIGKSNSCEDTAVQKPSVIECTWLQDFSSKFSMPELPEFLVPLMVGVPEGYQAAMLFHLLSMFGALCFSQVRAKYLDAKLHAPSLQVIIEAPWGSGKAKFEDMFNALFVDIILETRKKITIRDAEDEDGTIAQIIQIAGFNTSRRRLFDIFSNNCGVFFFAFESEIRSLQTAMRQGNGIRFEFLRKAFEDGFVDYDSMKKKCSHGTFPANFNYTVTGTPDDTAAFLKGELEGGTTSRIAFCTIPESSRDIPKLVLPVDGDLDDIRQQILMWRDQYVFKNISGQEIPHEFFEINLDYVCSALNDWLGEQWDKGDAEYNPARQNARARMAAIAFHCAIVLAMISGNPGEDEPHKREIIVNLTIYFANHCMERFLFKFGSQQNEERMRIQDAENVSTTVQSSLYTDEPMIGKVKLSVARQIKSWYQEGVEGHGFKATAKKFGLPEGIYTRRVLEALSKYEAEHPEVAK